MSDALLGIAASALLYLLFRDRDRVLALAGFAFFLVSSAAFLAADAGQFLIIGLAEDFAEGGAEGVDAGDAVILEIGRAVAIGSVLTEQVASTAFGAGLIAFGSLITWPPAGAVTPPRWIGWLATVAGLAFILSWFIALTDAAFVFFIIGGLGFLVWAVVLGVWLLRAPEGSPAEPARAAV